MFDAQRAEHWNALFSALNSELGWTGLLLMALGAVGGIAVLLRRRSIARFREKMLIIILGCLTLVLYVNSPFTGDNGSQGWQITPWIGTQMRFAISYLGLWSIVAIFGAEALRVPGKLLVLVSVLGCGWALHQLSAGWLIIGAMLAGAALLMKNRYREIARQLKRPLIRRSMLVLA